jgi:hypothetical protein
MVHLLPKNRALKSILTPTLTEKKEQKQLAIFLVVLAYHLNS